MKIIGIVENNYITGVVYGEIEVADQVVAEIATDKHHTKSARDTFNDAQQNKEKTRNIQLMYPRNFNRNRVKPYEFAARNAFNRAQQNKLKTRNIQLKTKHK